MKRVTNFPTKIYCWEYSKAIFQENLGLELHISNIANKANKFYTLLLNTFFFLLTYNCANL